MALPRAGPKVVVVMPAYNAAKTLHLTYGELPEGVCRQDDSGR